VQSSTDTGSASRQTFANITGHVITPDDSAYDEARTVFYGGIDKRPSAIIRAADADDVRRVVSIARDEELELAVRSGGHSIVGHSTTDGGIVLDLQTMSNIDVDMRSGTAWAQTGATALQFCSAADKHGVAVGFGDSGSVGVGGITLGGGVGYLTRKYGLTIDSLLAADVVTADGRLRHIDADTHPDLFWAIRGGGGNFGVATRFKFRLHEMPNFTGGILVLPVTPEIIARYVAAAVAAPDELSSIVNIMPAPPMPFLAKEIHGRMVMFAMLAYAGDNDSAERAIAPFRQLATPFADMVEPKPYPVMYPPEDHSVHPKAIGRTVFVDTINIATANTIMDFLSSSDAAMRVAQIRVLGGAAARVPNDATAYAFRSKAMIVNVAAFYEGPEDREVRKAWVAKFAAALQPNDTGGYVNFLMDEGEARVRAAYPGPTWDRLRKIKATYDPTNLFRLNQNIPPATR
jgi:FAD/FMN-containing dehydrogenase